MTTAIQEQKQEALAVLLSPAPVTTTLRLMDARIANGATRAAIDAFADEKLRQERQRLADLAHDMRTEGHSFPARLNRHDD